MRSLRTALLLILPAAAACSDSTRMGMGDVSSIIVVAEAGLWEQVGDTLLKALQPEVFAVRPEATFKLTHVAPDDPNWRDLRRFRQVLAVGRSDDAWVRPVLVEADTTVTPPAIVQATDVWARNQLASALVVPEEGAAAAVREQAAALADRLDATYRQWAVRRMYTSGVDTVLADTLAREGGFSISLPVVYTFRREGPNGFLAFNNQMAGTPLVRSVYVTWRSGTSGEPTAAEALAWRDSVGQAVYDWPQRSQPEPIQVRRIPGPDGGGIEVRGVWSGTADEGFPQAGPFITRVVDCPASDRRYLIDTWLYAPATEKYQYVIQLESLLGSFRCGRRPA
ncbi:MAG TPA: DUF4837 family protein [Longimicrobiales bacterium]|nr:DUF4837 family protein [Longimicrobiales bacterium]